MIDYATDWAVSPSFPQRVPGPFPQRLPARGSSGSCFGRCVGLGAERLRRRHDVIMTSYHFKSMPLRHHNDVESGQPELSLSARPRIAGRLSPPGRSADRQGVEAGGILGGMHIIPARRTEPARYRGRVRPVRHHRRPGLQDADAGAIRDGGAQGTQGPGDRCRPDRPGPRRPARARGGEPEGREGRRRRRGRSSGSPSGCTWSPAGSTTRPCSPSWRSSWAGPSSRCTTWPYRRRCSASSRPACTRPGWPTVAAGRREAVRHRPGVGARAGRRAQEVLPGGAHLPGRPLPRQGVGRGHPRVPVREHADGAGLEQLLHPHDPDHHGGELRRRGPRLVLRPGRRDPRRRAEPPAPGARAAHHGAAGLQRPRLAAGREVQGAARDPGGQGPRHWSAASTPAIRR